MQVTYTEYHSQQWATLVEMGWITDVVESWDGVKPKMARMVRDSVVPSGLPNLSTWRFR